MKESPFSSFLGQPDNLRNNQAHTDFYESVGQWVKQYLLQKDRTQLRAVVRLIFFSAKPQEGKAAYWYLISAQAHADLLIPLLSPEDRLQLAEEYKLTYPKGKRLPIQNHIYELLNGKERQRSWLSLRRR